jgi:hypothetical protein
MAKRRSSRKYGKAQSAARRRTHEPIPKDFEVRPLRTQKAKDRAGCVATCGHCGLSWDDDKITGYTPAPSARCPFESWHIYND